MPTARELLEQADALMRRNRVDDEDDIPVLTDAVPSVAEAPMPSPRPTGDPAVATPEQTVFARQDPAASDVVAVPDGAASLTATEHEGEPSVWLDFEDAEPSVIGDAPDSVAIVPPFEGRQVADEALLASAEHEEIELTTPPGEFDEDTVESAAVSREDPVPSLASLESAASVDAAEDSSASAELPEDASSMEPDREGAPGAREVAPDFVAAGAPMPPPAAVQATSPGHFGPDDRAHWDSVAEEIRMQVLQRIDLFTDTGLREQLGARLKPIVDRASADLVATINQHVGELLRAYVAEAIEREIERWRRDN